MAEFLEAVIKTLVFEGGLVDNPDDPGGLTNFGISIKAHPEFTPSQIRAMTKSQAIGIYRAKYWNPLYEGIENQVVADLLFDFGVTSGVLNAVAELQSSLARCVAGPVVPDGKFGPQTLGFVNSANPVRLIREYVIERLEFYAKIEKLEFDHSWFGRTIDSVLI